ncbi:MAG: hypothetical protein L3J20_05535 [Flavobacteriaceae bacterium]|nr:hypothetical protein [Flavobacteriaceae bacterium]
MNLSKILIGLLLITMNVNAQYEKRANPDDYTTPVLKAIAYGLTAPSPHNTQSWYLDTISDTEMLMYVKHVLPETDPPARQIMMGAGCFIELMNVGMSQEGYETNVDYLPQGDFQIIANKISDKPIAKITFVKNDNVKKDVLYDYIYQRGTNRKPYRGKMITQSEFENIKTLMGDYHSQLQFFTGEKQMQPYLNIFSKAMEIETRTKSTNEETRQKFRFSEKELKEKKDGISLQQMGYEGFILKIATKQMNNGDSLTWHGEKTFKATMKGINKGIYSSKGLIFFKTKTNTKLDWIKSGRDYSRFNIAIAKFGIVTHPYNQVIQEYPEMEGLQKKFKTLSKVTDSEKIQMIVRVGRAKISYKSWRKEVEDYIMD